MIKLIQTKIYSKNRLYTKLSQFLKTKPSTDQYFLFLEKHLKFFIHSKINPWEVYFNSRIMTDINPNQILDIMDIFSQFIKIYNLDYSLNDNIIVHSIEINFFDYVFHSGVFPLIDSNYSLKFLNKMIQNGLIIEDNNIKNTQYLLEGFSIASETYSWNLDEFNKLIKEIN